MKLPGNPFSSLPNTSPDPDVPQDVPRQEEMLRATLVTTYTTPEASPELRRRIADMAALRDQQMVMSPAPRWRPLKVTLASSVFVLLIGAYFIGPRLYAALTLRRIQQAMLNTHTAHITIWRPVNHVNISELPLSNENRVKISEIWNEGDKWRIAQDEGRWLDTRGVNGMPMKRGSGDYEQFGPETPLLAFRPPGLPQWKGLSLLDSVGDTTLYGLQSHLERFGNAWTGRNTLYLYCWKMAGIPKDCLVLFVDPRTKFLHQVVVQHQDEYDVWRTTAEIDYEFNEPMPPRTFDYPMHPEVKLQEAHLSRAEWWTKLNMPIMQSQVGGKNIAVRDFRVNAVGDVFMLYTVDKGKGRYSHEAQTLTDDKGNVYLRTVHSFPFRPTIYDDKGKTQGFTFENGKELKAAWWVPLRPQNGKAWNPRRYSLTFLPDPYSQKDFSKKKFVSFSLPVYQTDTAIVPPYMPYMALKPGDLWPECALPVVDARERAIFNQESLRDMNQAQQWLKVEQQKWEDWERTAHRPLRTDVFLRQYQVLSALGRHDEARAALRKARTRSFNTRSWDEAIKKAMKKEGME